MARRVDVPNETIFCGFDQIIEWPIVDEETDLPVSLSTFSDIEFEIRRDRKQAAAVLTKKLSTGGILLGTTDAGIAAGVAEDMVRVSLAADDTMNTGTGAPTIHGMYQYTLFRSDSGNRRVLAFGNFPITLTGGRV